MGVLIGSFLILISLFYFILLIFGLLLCRKNHFIAGFYFFLIIIILKLYDFISPYTIQQLSDSYFVNNASLPMGMTFGEAISLLSLIPRTIEVIAFIILVVGLYRLWKDKTFKP